MSADFATINLAAINFDDWERPWEFLAFICNFPHSSPGYQATVADVWTEATKAIHWTHGTLSLGADAAAESLGRLFPALAADAIASFVRAASYQWR